MLYIHIIDNNINENTLALNKKWKEHLLDVDKGKL